MPVVLRWFLRLWVTNPITVRLVQNGSRRVRHLYIRAAYLAVLIVVLLWSLLAATGAGAMSYRELAQAGASSFEAIAYLQVGLICVLAPVFMAGAIAQEASPRTWEVLLTTPMTAVQIVLGNLTGRLFFILALLFSSLPLFALTQFFGGVPGRSIFASYAIAACAALLVGAIAISLSVSRLVGKRAVFAFYVSVVSYLAVTFAIDVWLRSVGNGAAGGGGVTWMTAINPFLVLKALLNPTGYPVAEAGTHTGMGAWFLEHPVKTWCYGSMLLSLVLVLASTVTVRAGGIAAMTGATERTGVPWYRKIFGLGAAGAEHRPPRPVWVNPIAWREAAARNSTLPRIVARWSFIALGAIWGIALIVMYHNGGMSPAEFRLAITATVLGEVIITTLVGMNMSATAISREREDGTLDLLLTTPITPSSYLTGKLRGLIAYLLPLLLVPIGTLAVAGIYVLVGLAGGSNKVQLKESIAATTPTGATTIMAPVLMPESAILAALVVIPFMAFCVMIGLQWSLKSKGTLSSVVGTVGVVGVISGVVGLCGWNAGSSVPMVGPFLGALSPASALYALVYPVDAMEKTVVDAGNLNPARLSLWVGCGVAAVVYLAIVYGVHASLVKNFDFTVRKLAGIR
jgi:ABC-type transport system involved in multi-copper enzyme maturation permease subunit